MSNMDIAGVDVEIDVIRELPELEDLEVNPSTEDQSFNSSKYGFKNVIIKGIKGDKLELNPSLEQQNVKGVFTEVNINPIQTKKLNATPTTQEQVISGLFDEVTVNAIEGQELNLNPSEEQQNFEGVFLGVNINPIQVEEITTDLDFSDSDAIEITAQEGAYIKKTTINKPTNLSPENIKSGETVCGIAGTNADTSDADATSSDIAVGKTAYVNNEKVTGTMEVSDYNAEIGTSLSAVGEASYGSKLHQIVRKINSLVIDWVSANYMFNQCYKLEEIKNLNTDKVTSVVGIFQQCGNLLVAPIMNTSNATIMGAMFKDCSKLTTVPIYDTSRTRGLAGAFTNCSSLTDESLNNILQMCINTTSAYTDTKTLKRIGLSSDQATRCQSLSNYQAFLDARVDHRILKL